MQALQGMAWLLVAQSAGEALAKLLALKLPGPVIGLLLMLTALSFEPVRAAVGAAADALLAHLSLLFVPVGVGVMTHLALLSQYGVRMLLVIGVSTLVGMAVTGLVLQAFLKERG